MPIPANHPLSVHGTATGDGARAVPPLSLCDISPVAMRLGRAATGAESFCSPSTQSGEMSRSDRGGRSSCSPRHRADLIRSQP
jgi:hypothetical protein